MYNMRLLYFINLSIVSYLKKNTIFRKKNIYVGFLMVEVAVGQIFLVYFSLQPPEFFHQSSRQKCSYEKENRTDSRTFKVIVSDIGGTLDIKGHAVAQLVQALSYKPRGSAFDCRRSL
jgi:hypothetical protein